MTRDDFITYYLNNSRMSSDRKTKDGFKIVENDVVVSNYVALPCGCQEEGCLGWAMIRRNPAAVQEHLFFYGPEPKVVNTPILKDEERQTPQQLKTMEDQIEKAFEMVKDSNG